MSGYTANDVAPLPFGEVLLTTKQAAHLLAVSPSTLAYWRSVGDGPSYTRLGVRTIRYRREDVKAYGALWPNHRLVNSIVR